LIRLPYENLGDQYWHKQTTIYDKEPPPESAEQLEEKGYVVERDSTGKVVSATMYLAKEQKFRKDIKGGLRPTILDDCPQMVQHLMIDCWDNDPSKRPSMANVIERLQAELAREVVSKPAPPTIQEKQVAVRIRLKS